VFSDFYLRRVQGADPQGRVQVLAEIDDQPSGLGWLPDGALLVVGMLKRQVLRIEKGGVRVHADLSRHVHAPCNDMLVDAQGRAYVGNFGFDLHLRAPFAPTVLLLVQPDGSVQVAARDIHFPNGMVLSPDGRTLVVAESYGKRLTAFDVRSDGTLAGRRVWAAFSEKGAWPRTASAWMPRARSGSRRL
jgi:sugar lactone lactonase YvrE